MMAETSEKPEVVLNLEELLQCPVCYEIPIGQIFQCNEGHHVCGKCKMRLDVCPVCRAFFFGTRNYAMEELIANFMKVNEKKGSCKDSKSTIGSLHAAVIETSDAEIVIQTPPVVEDHESDSNPSTNSLAPPLSCRGLYRCLCCQQGSVQRLPLARLLNHLRYFHSPMLIEGSCENSEYVQAWQFSSSPGRIVTSIRVKQMGVFFLVIEIVENKALYAWITMAASAWVSHGFNFTLTISGNDREAIFTDSVWSVKACEGTLKKHGHTLSVTASNARAMLSSVNLSGKLSLRRLNYEELPNQTQPRGILRVANRGSHSENSYDIEPFLQDLQSDVARLTRAFATLSNATANAWNTEINPNTERNSESNVVPSPQDADEVQPLSRNARRRMRRRLRTVFSSPPAPEDYYADNTPRQNANINRQTNSTSIVRLSSARTTPIQGSSARATISNGFIIIPGIATLPRPTGASNLTRQSGVATSGRPTSVSNSTRPTADDASSGRTINDTIPARPAAVATSGRTTGVANSPRPTSVTTAVRTNGVANSARPTGVVTAVRTNGVANSARPTGVVTAVRTNGVANSARPTGVVTAVRTNGVANSARPTGVVTAVRTNGVATSARRPTVANSSRPTCVTNPTRQTGSATSGRTTGVANSSRPTCVNNSTRPTVVATSGRTTGVANSSRPTCAVSSSVNTNHTAPDVILTGFPAVQEVIHSQPSSSSGSSNRQPQANRPNKKKPRHRR